VSLPPEAIATRAAAEARVGKLPHALALDTRELRASDPHAGDRKLGLGSSAAAAAAVAGAVYAASGRDLRDASTRAELLEVSLEGHRAVAPEGSGADVAAAVLGGFVRFRRLGSGVETHPISWPSEVSLTVVWTKKPVRTSDMLAAVSELARREPRAHRTAMQALARESDDLISLLIPAAARSSAELGPESGFQTTEIKSLIAAFDACGAAMGVLGDAAGVRILDETTERIRQLARAEGGAAKPSGAGGGDVVVAALPGPAETARFSAACAEAGFEVLSLDLGVIGERQEQ
jgi:phosphomevalonate kinase